MTAMAESSRAARSIVESFRDDDGKVLAAMSADERVALALALGRRDLETFRLAQDPPLSVEDATRILERQRQAGRRRSACLEELIG